MAIGLKVGDRTVVLRVAPGTSKFENGTLTQVVLVDPGVKDEQGRPKEIKATVAMVDGNMVVTPLPGQGAGTYTFRQDAQSPSYQAYFDKLRTQVEGKNTQVDLPMGGSLEFGKDTRYGTREYNKPDGTKQTYEVIEGVTYSGPLTSKPVTGTYVPTSAGMIIRVKVNDKGEYEKDENGKYVPVTPEEEKTGTKAKDLNIGVGAGPMGATGTGVDEVKAAADAAIAKHKGGKGSHSPTPQEDLGGLKPPPALFTPEQVAAVNAGPLAGMSKEEIQALQRKMHDAGLYLGPHGSTKDGKRVGDDGVAGRYTTAQVFEYLKSKDPSLTYEAFLKLKPEQIRAAAELPVAPVAPQTPAAETPAAGSPTTPEMPDIGDAGKFDVSQATFDKDFEKNSTVNNVTGMIAGKQVTGKLVRMQQNGNDIYVFEYTGKDSNGNDVTERVKVGSRTYWDAYNTVGERMVDAKAGLVKDGKITIEDFNTDNDKTISASEVDAFAQRAGLGKVDTSGDGKISPEEMQAMLAKYNFKAPSNIKLDDVEAQASLVLGIARQEAAKGQSR